MRSITIAGMLSLSCSYACKAMQAVGVGKRNRFCSLASLEGISSTSTPVARLAQPPERTVELIQVWVLDSPILRACSEMNEHGQRI